MVAVATDVLQGVNRDDRPAVVGERVAVAGIFRRTRWIPSESRRTSGMAKRGPQLVLELFEDVPGELGQQESDLEGLPETDCVGDEHTGLEVVERLVDGTTLVFEAVQKLPAGHSKVSVARRHRRLAQDGLEVQAAAAEVRRIVVDQTGFLGRSGSMRSRLVKNVASRSRTNVDVPMQRTMRPSDGVC